MKINAAYETGKYNYLGKDDASSTNRRAIEAGLTQTDQVVERVLGVPIHYNMLVDFQAFKQGVNTVGGVTVNVPNELYDPTMSWENGWNPVLAQPGTQKFDGNKALLYVRSRETSSDFARSERQREVILALKNKIESVGTLSNPLKISQLTSTFGNNVQTDLSLSDSGRLYDIVKGIADKHVTSIGLTDSSNSYVTTGDIGGQSVVFPKAGLFDYSAIQEYVRHMLPDGYILKEHAKVAVFNGTGTPGVATKEAKLLKSYGYKVGRVANAPTSTYNKTVLVDLTHGRDKYTKHYLERRFDVSAVAKIPDPAITAGQSDFIIIIGKNEISNH
jgi:LCP family protein required for cell wall assembly